MPHILSYLFPLNVILSPSKKYMNVNISTAVPRGYEMEILLHRKDFWIFGNTSTVYCRYFGKLEIRFLLDSHFLAVWKYFYFLP
jgi:hypothetical protein